MEEPRHGAINDATLARLCAEWQRRLRLMDWRVAVRLADSEDLETYGECKTHRDDKLALVRIQRPESVDQSSGWFKNFPETYDTETVLVHELLHIHLDGLMNQEADDAERAAQENAINFISEALVKLKGGE